MIIGIGTDIVEISRLKGVLDRYGDQFRARVYTPVELGLAMERGGGALAFYAGRWAAKEAASKALGCGIGAECSFTDVEIINNSAGRPLLTFKGRALARFQSIGGTRVNISISHEHSYAVATVIVSGPDHR